MTLSYRLSRAGLRAGIEFYGRPVRLLGWDRVPDGAALFAVHRPPSQLEAMMLVAVCERPIRWLLPEDLPHGFGRIWSSAAHAITYRADREGRNSAHRACTEALAAEEILAVFTGDERAGGDGAGLDIAQGIAHAAWASAFPGEEPLMVPVHSFWPAERAGEIVIHVGSPLIPEGASVAEPQLDQEVFASEVPADETDQTVFALDPDAFKRLLENVEEALLDRLERQWAERSGWKQKVDGFRLSAPAAAQLQRLNLARPEDLVTLQRQFDACRELRRQWSLTQIRAEQGRKRFSAVQRLLIWIESVLGFPVALWGALNHAAIALLLYLLGLTGNWRELQPGRWAARAAVVLGGWAGQVALVGHFMGRAAAGYYAVTLPLSGAYLWRYAWLLWWRTRILLLGARARTLRRLAESRWQAFLTTLDAILALPVRVASTAARN